MGKWDGLSKDGGGKREVMGGERGIGGGRQGKDDVGDENSKRWYFLELASFPGLHRSYRHLQYE